MQERENGFQQPLQSSLYGANNSTCSHDLFVPSVQQDCNPNPVNRQEHGPHSFPHSICASPILPRAASTPKRSPRKHKHHVDDFGGEQERDDDVSVVLLNIYEKYCSNN